MALEKKRVSGKKGEKLIGKVRPSQARKTEDAAPLEIPAPGQSQKKKLSLKERIRDALLKGKHRIETASSVKKDKSGPGQKEDSTSRKSILQKEALQAEKRKKGKELSKPIIIKPPIEKPGKVKMIDQYEFLSNNIPITIRIYKKKEEFVATYEVSISSISKTTEIILEKIRTELISEVSLGIADITKAKKAGDIEKKFDEAVSTLINKYFPNMDGETKDFLTTYLIQKSLGMGKIEILMDDVNLEEISVNSAEEPVWVSHRKHGWLKTNIHVGKDDQTRHYATMIGRKIGRQITVLEPLLDAHLTEGDRVNATLNPISTRGNTLTIRKFSRDPWTITKMLKSRTISPYAASLIWLCVQYELSAIISGGTASGKTSMLNVIANFFPPNQRIISIEDTREIQLPKFLHWVPMSTRLPNAEGKGGISMLDLLVNSLRMRPDRIIVGEVRRSKEAEVLFEAIHTGHSVYATFHANNVEETITRLTNPPINVPRVMLPAISMVIVQYRNRRTGMRRTFQVAEVTEKGDARTILQFDPKRDALSNADKASSLMDTLNLYTNYSMNEINKIIKEKEKILKYMVKQNIEDIDLVGKAMAEYYTDKESFMKMVNANKKFG